MNHSTAHYMPIIKWRQGEYQALLNLKSKIKDKITPLIVIPPREYDFEEGRMKKTVHEHIEPFAKRLKAKWADRLAFIDLHDSLEEESMDTGEGVVSFVLRASITEKCKPRPIIGIKKSDNYIKQVKSFFKQTNGAALRLSLEETMGQSPNIAIDNLLEKAGLTPTSIDLIIDIGAPESFEPYKAFANAITQSIFSINNLKNYRSITIAGTSLNLSKVKKPGATVKRHEWTLYLEILSLCSKFSIQPSFGDYTIETPSFSNLDMRKMKPSGKIVYATEDSWHIRKGGVFREDPSQMKDHCEAIISSGHYMDKDFSKGDYRIYETANELDNYGNLTTWKNVAVNHHITVVVTQIANLHGA